MDHQFIFNLLKELEIPVAYDHFESNKEIIPPFIAYRETNPEIFQADDISYYRPYNYEIELVTEKKEPAVEQAIENLLTENKIPYEISGEVWDEDEKIYHNFYEI